MVVSESFLLRRSVQMFLKPLGCEVLVQQSIDEAALIVLDYQPDVVFVACTDPGLQKQGFSELGDAHYLNKPFAQNDLICFIEESLSKNHMV